MHKPIPNFWQLLHLTRNWNRSNTCPQNRCNTFPVNFGQIILRYYFDKHSIKTGQVKEGAKRRDMKFILHTLQNSTRKNYHFLQLTEVTYWSKYNTGWKNNISREDYSFYYAKPYIIRPSKYATYKKFWIWRIKYRQRSFQLPYL